MNIHKRKATKKKIWTDRRCVYLLLVSFMTHTVLAFLYYRNLEHIGIWQQGSWMQEFMSKGHQSGATDQRNNLEAGIAKSKLYVRSITSFQRHLDFFHIPKTAGTAIEEAAAKQQIPWGSCAFNHKPKRDVCRHLYPGREWPLHLGWWHIPTQLFPLRNINPYHHAERFAVIRNPYDRMVSEFYYICTLKVTDWRPDQCHNRTQLFDPSYMNHWLTNKLQNRDAKSDELYYLTDNGHFVSQYEFLVGPFDVRMIDYVLRLDGTLSHDFRKLMKAFQLQPIRLQKLNAISAEPRNSTKHLTVENLNQETIGWIHQRYPFDFERLQYEKK